MEEVIKCKRSSINIQHTDPVEANIDISLPLKDDKLVKLQESDPHTTTTQKTMEKQQPGQKHIHHEGRHSQEKNHR